MGEWVSRCFMCDILLQENILYLIAQKRLEKIDLNSFTEIWQSLSQITNIPVRNVMCALTVEHLINTKNS